MENGAVFKAFGILTFIFELLVVFTLWIGNRREPIPFEIKPIARISIFFLLATAIGIGLMYKRKWAAIGFSLANLSIASGFIIGSLLNLTNPAALINIAIGAFFLIPVFIAREFRAALYSRHTNIP